MVSSTNEQLALQHYGQKLVYGHVMTNSGRRILIQITFDVMNLRKPLLSTSALKHRASQSSSITIMTASFFETRPGIWYLTIVIPTYISLWRMNPACKAMVMAGENAANDVDEEVYGNAWCRET